MPDLQSELKKLETLRFDDEDAPAPTPVGQQPPNTLANITQQLWSFIKDNPGVSVSEMPQQWGDLSSRLLQMTVRGNLNRTLHEGKYRYYVAKDEYMALSSAEATRRANEARREKAAKRKAHKEAVARRARERAEREEQARRTVPQAPTPTTVPSTADDFLNTLSVVQAHDLYLKLKEIFRGS